MTERRFLVVVAAGLALTLPALPAAEATPVNYAFSVTATTGPLTGVTANGTFSYDTGSIVPGGVNNATGLLTALDFTWDGIHYNQTTANTGVLAFDPTGQLTIAQFGTNCTPGCGLPASESWNLFLTTLPGVQNSFAYNVDGVPPPFPPGYFISFTPTFSPVTAGVPEPSALALLGAGLAGLALTAIRRRRPRT